MRVVSFWIPVTLALVMSYTYCKQQEEIVITIVNTAQQVTEEKKSEPKPLPPCHNLFGKQLAICLNYQDDASFKDLFFALNAYARMHYLNDLKIEDHIVLLQRFTETEWADYYKTLNQEQKKFLPKTLQEQWDIITKAHIICESCIRRQCFATALIPESHKPGNVCAEDAFEAAMRRNYQSLKEDLLSYYSRNR